MNKTVAIALVAVAVIAVFWLGGFSGSAPNFNRGKLTLPFTAPETLQFPTIEGTPVGLEAWAVFQEYLAAAKAHDLDRVKALSYQLSPACSDPNRVEECRGLMDSVYFFASGLKQNNFTNVAYDDRQIVLSTDYIMLEGNDEPVKNVLYFVRSESGPKILGLRFCIGAEGEGDECVETSRAKRDQDQDGWWDDVESLFYQ